LLDGLALGAAIGNLQGLADLGEAENMNESQLTSGSPSQ
jgi:hypothetical protein